MTLETPPWRLKNPWRMPSQLSRDDAQNMALSGVTMAGSVRYGQMLWAERRGWRKVGSGKSKRLEQYPHLLGVDQPRCARSDRFGLLRGGALKQSIAALTKAELEQELAVRHRGVGLQAERARLPLEIGEIDVGGEIGASRIGKGRGKAMAAHGLQRVAEAGFVVTIIDDEGGEGGETGAASRLTPERPRRWPRFEDGTVRRRVREISRLSAELEPIAFGEVEATTPVARDQTLAPGPVAVDKLPDGEGIDEFIGEHDERTVRQIIQRRVPANRHPSLAKSASLCRNHDGTCLDERDRDGVEECRHCTPGAERIRHQGAAPRTKLGDGHGAWRAHRLPDGDGPQANQLAEDLADLGCGDEVAGAADRLA